MDTLKRLPYNYYNDRAIGPEGFISTLYKYMPIKTNATKDIAEKVYNENLINSLREGYLWHGSPDSFNDLHDSSDRLIDYTPSPEAIRQITNQLPTRKERRNQKRQLSKNPQPIINAYRNTAIQQSVCCFTSNLISNLLWSHYADSHYGLCLVFDHNQLLKDSLLIHKVTYEETFKAINYFNPTQDAAICKFTTKSIEWKYEDEYRSINDVFGKLMFSRKALVGITFGARTANEDILYIVDLVNREGYHQLKWQKASIQHNTFDLKIEPLDINLL